MFTTQSFQIYYHRIDNYTPLQKIHILEQHLPYIQKTWFESTPSLDALNDHKYANALSLTARFEKIILKGLIGASPYVDLLALKQIYMQHDLDSVQYCRHQFYFPCISNILQAAQWSILLSLQHIDYHLKALPTYNLLLFCTYIAAAKCNLHYEYVLGDEYVNWEQQLPMLDQLFKDQAPAFIRDFYNQLAQSCQLETQLMVV